MRTGLRLLLDRVFLPDQMMVAKFGGYNAIGITLALFNCLIAFAYLIFGDDQQWFSSAGLVSFAIFLVLVVRRLNNILFLARTAFLGGIGYYPILIKAVMGPDALFSFYETSTQGMEIVVVMYVATTLALLGNEIGLTIGARGVPVVADTGAFNSAGLWRFFFYFSVPTLLLVSYLTANAAGPTIFIAQYASQESAMVMGNIQTIGGICLLAMYVAMAKRHVTHATLLFLFVAFAFLVWAMMLRGGRQDVVSAVLGLLVCYGLVRRREFGIGGKGVVLMFLFVLAIELWGIVRTVISAGAVSLSELWTLFTHTMANDDAVYHFGTVSPTATTFANTVSLVREGAVNHLYGLSFLEFIPRTPPQFLYPDRPQDYSGLFLEHDLQTGGGFFELAEAYINFGYIGALLVPLVVSFLIARAFRNALFRQSVISYFVMFSLLAVFLRGTWYQLFAFYKSFVTMLIVFLFVWGFRQLMVASSRPIPRTQLGVGFGRADDQFS